MARIHPTENQSKQTVVGGDSIVLTVWKTSIAFHGTDGFSVFDCNGSLAYRVDCYSPRNRCKTLVISDDSGISSLTLRQKLLSMHDRWEAFEGEVGQKTSVFTLRKRWMVQINDEAEVYMGSSTFNFRVPDFHIDGSFTKRTCKIRQTSGEVVAEISRKQANSEVSLGDDVFHLIIQPGFDSKLIVAFIAIMDRICWKPFAPAF